VKARRFLRAAKAPGGLVHLSDVRRGQRTLCGRGVFTREGWKIGTPASASCAVCARISRRKYGV
jgi:hypothetical protein